MRIREIDRRKQTLRTYTRWLKVWVKRQLAEGVPPEELRCYWQRWARDTSRGAIPSARYLIAGCMLTNQIGAWQARRWVRTWTTLYPCRCSWQLEDLDDVRRRHVKRSWGVDI